MISALIQGTLKGVATQRMGKVPFVTATVRVPTDGSEAVFVNVISFEDAPRNALLSLHPGEPVALAGTLTPDVWINKEGEPRPQLKMIVTAVLTIASARRKRGMPRSGETRAAFGSPSRNGAI